MSWYRWRDRFCEQIDVVQSTRLFIVRIQLVISVHMSLFKKVLTECQHHPNSYVLIWRNNSLYTWYNHPRHWSLQPSMHYNLQHYRYLHLHLGPLIILQVNCKLLFFQDDEELINQTQDLLLLDRPCPLHRCLDWVVGRAVIQVGSTPSQSKKMFSFVCKIYILKKRHYLLSIIISAIIIMFGFQTFV